MLKLFLIPALATLAYTKSTVTSMFIFGADEQPLAASIVGNDATATTYSINCPPGTSSDECGMGPGMTLIAADDTTTFIFNDGEAFQYTADCSVHSSRAVCTESAGGSEANFPGVSTTTTGVGLIPVTVTAGDITDAETTVSATASATLSSTGSVDGSSSATTSTGAETASTRSAAASESENTSSAAAEADPTPTGATVRVTGAVGLVFGAGVVALLGAGI
ncbi:hypothetical protein BDW59DRAFT_153886 [Aspergillus cavernicola]|uniref:GPI anchored protein n=1 Tax=Aspergillus cavernicola TaxID=176166 RepID=A0ABR4HIS6_9EURO